jgi:hypothetical protein
MFYYIIRFSKWKDHFDILDENRQPVLRIIGPCMVWDGACCPCDNKFRVMALDGQTEVGNVTKEYAGFIKEAFTTADNFSINCK